MLEIFVVSHPPRDMISNFLVWCPPVLLSLGAVMPQIIYVRCPPLLALHVCLYSSPLPTHQTERIDNVCGIPPSASEEI